MNITIEQLRLFKPLENIPTPELEWLKERLSSKTFPSGSSFFRKGDPVNHTFFILEGEFEFFLDDGKNKKAFGLLLPGDITGLLPFSRLKEATASCTTIKDGIVAYLSRADLQDMIRECYKLTEVLVHEMNNRIRNSTQQEVQNEKLIALGKLSAGLAHELNNPAAAMVRSASLLQQYIKSTPEKFKAIMNIQLNDQNIDEINGLMYKKIEHKSTLSLMEKSSIEDELFDWFDDHEEPDADELVPFLADYNFSPEDLDLIKSKLRKEDINPVLNWIIQNITIEKTVSEIKEASERIESLVSSVKSYSYMDRNKDTQAFDLQDGIRNTLAILQHKIKKQGVKIETSLLETPIIVNGLPGELNQVWTNLLDNAFDAVPESKGVVRIQTSKTENFIKVVIEDNGHGIPDEIKTHIFEPFYTTKEIGKGTGLGLDIVQKIIKNHRGWITVRSVPGKTQFEIHLPST